MRRLPASTDGLSAVEFGIAFLFFPRQFQSVSHAAVMIYIYMYSIFYLIFSQLMTVLSYALFMNYGGLAGFMFACSICCLRGIQVSIMGQVPTSESMLHIHM